MKKLTVLILIVVAAMTSKAQGFFDAGIKAGMNTSKISTHIDDYNPQTINNYSFGAFARFNIGRFYLQPEAYYNSKGGEYIDEVNMSTINSFDLKTIDVPALIGLKIIDKKALNLRIMAGPMVSFLTDKSVKGQLTKDNLENSLPKVAYNSNHREFLVVWEEAVTPARKEIFGQPRNERSGPQYPGGRQRSALRHDSQCALRSQPLRCQGRGTS